MTTAEITTPETSTANAEQIATRLLGILNDGAIAFLASVGHQTGLFETLTALPAATSVQIADAAGLEERYVREWLGGMVTAGFVDYEPAERTYALRADHAPFLCGPGPDNLARSMQFITMMGHATTGIVQAFRAGGGLTYADYPGFHGIMASDSRAILDAFLFDSILPLTGEIDRLRAGIDVVDIGCGQGHAINLMAREFRHSRFSGFDFEQEPIAAARAEARLWGLENVRFEVRDVAAGIGDDAVDLITAFDTIHDQANPAQTLANVANSLRPNGTFLMADIDASSHLEKNRDVPWASFLYAASTAHCLSVSLAQGGAGLGTVWGVELAEQMLRDAGFSTVEQHRIESNPMEVYMVARN